MPDRRALPERLSQPELRDALMRLLPHGSFDIIPMPESGPEAIQVRCRCGRALRWVGHLPFDILLYWLADHNDEIFLSHAEREKLWNEQVPSLLMSPWPFPAPVLRPEEKVAAMRAQFDNALAQDDPGWKVPHFPAGQTPGERVAAMVEAAGFGPVPKRVEVTYEHPEDRRDA